MDGDGEQPVHNDSKWASQFRQHGITAAALSTHHLYFEKK